MQHSALGEQCWPYPAMKEGTFKELTLEAVCVFLSLCFFNNACSALRIVLCSYGRSNTCDNTLNDTFVVRLIGIVVRAILKIKFEFEFVKVRDNQFFSDVIPVLGVH